MAVRPVDAEKYMELLKEQYLHHEAMGNKQVAKAWQGAMQLLYDMPALTPPNEWIGVKDRLPEDDASAGRKQITVMVATKAGKVTIASRVFKPERECRGKVYPARWIWSRWLNNYVTHWMPLPAPPEKENSHE